MEWSVGGDSSRYKAALGEEDGRVRISTLSQDGVDVDTPNVVVVRDEKQGRLRVEVDGRPRLVYVAKSRDAWWIHMDGHTHVVHCHEQGSSGPSTSEGSLSAPMPGTGVNISWKRITASLPTTSRGCSETATARSTSSHISRNPTPARSARYSGR